MELIEFKMETNVNLYICHNKALTALVFLDSPSTTKLLSADSNIRIALRKRVRIGLPDGIVGKEVEIQESTLGRAEIEEVQSGREGILFIRGSIGTGKTGREASWAVPKVCDLQVSCTFIYLFWMWALTIYKYCITVRIPALSSMSKDVASWEGEVVVGLSTNSCEDTGDSKPALEMAKLVPKLTTYQMSHYAL